jgi:hypothetical protein
MEYLNWQQYKYTAEIFTAEASTSRDTVRTILERSISKENEFAMAFEEDIPILLEIMLKVIAANDK